MVAGQVPAVQLSDAQRRRREFCINFIGEDNEIMLTCNLHNLLKSSLEYTAPVGLFGLIITIHAYEA